VYSFSKLKAFSVQVSKVEEERKKWSNKFSGGIIKNRYPRQIIIYSLFFEEGKEYTVH